MDAGGAVLGEDGDPKEREDGQGHAGPAGAGRLERDWQRAHLPEQIRALVLQDQIRRNPICWYVFSD